MEAIYLSSWKNPTEKTFKQLRSVELGEIDNLEEIGKKKKVVRIVVSDKMA